MRVLWITNVIFPFPSKMIGKKESPFGGWLLGLFNYLKKYNDLTIAIASVYDGNKLLKYIDQNVVYYLLPNNKKMCDSWCFINNDFIPDLVHIHGTEYSYGYYYQKACPNVKTIVSIQGLLTICSNFYLANLKSGEVKSTFRDLIKGSIYKNQNLFKKKSLIEKKMIQNAYAVVGRTTWDLANTYAISLKNNYYKCNESLRDSFYDYVWNYNNISNNTIFVSQANYPLKGFHILLDAIYILKNNYKDIKVYVAGNNIIDDSTFLKKSKMTGYAKFLLNKIKDYNLQDNIIFLGLLSESEIISELMRANVFVQTSSIENSSNALGEAMIVGMPCVASNVGGTSDLIVDKEEGFLYPFGDYGLLAYYISKIFDEPKMAISMGKKARKHALNTHDKEKNAKCMFNIYKKIFNEK